MEKVSLAQTDFPGFNRISQTYYVEETQPGNPTTVHWNEVWQNSDGKFFSVFYVLYEAPEKARNSFTLTRSHLTYPADSLSVGEAGYTSFNGKQYLLSFQQARMFITLYSQEKDLLPQIAEKLSGKISVTRL